MLSASSADRADDEGRLPLAPQDSRFGAEFRVGVGDDRDLSLLPSRVLCGVGDDRDLSLMLARVLCGVGDDRDLGRLLARVLCGVGDDRDLDRLLACTFRDSARSDRDLDRLFRVFRNSAHLDCDLECLRVFLVSKGSPVSAAWGPQLEFVLAACAARFFARARQVAPPSPTQSASGMAPDFLGAGRLDFSPLRKGFHSISDTFTLSGSSLSWTSFFFSIPSRLPILMLRLLDIASSSLMSITRRCSTLGSTSWQAANS